MIYLFCDKDMRKKFLDLSIKKIHEKFPDYSSEKLEEIAYGIEALYITFTKTIYIALLSLVLGIFKEVFFVLLFYNAIRTVAFGLHAKTSLQCYIMSTVFFVGAGLLCKYIDINYYIKIVITIFCFINICLFAPADTYKRPLINKKKRNIYKILSIIISLIYVVLVIIYPNTIWSNYLMFGLIDSTLMIHPLIYRMFQLPYNNYKTYNEAYN